MTLGALCVWVAAMRIRSMGMPVALEANFLASSQTVRGIMQLSTTAMAMSDIQLDILVARFWSPMIPTMTMRRSYVQATIPTMAGMVAALSGMMLIHQIERFAKNQTTLMEDHLADRQQRED